MRRSRLSLSVLSSIGLAVIVAAGCGGGSGSVTGADDVSVAATGHAVIQGTVTGPGFFTTPDGGVTTSSADNTMTVEVEGTGLSTGVDEEGEFILSGVPAGSVTLAFTGGGANARLTLSGLVDGQVLSVQVRVSGGDAHVTTPPETTPHKNTKITGTLNEMNDTRLVVGDHRVDASDVRKVYRGNRRIELQHLVVGEKVKVWGTLRGDGVLMAEEIKALTSGVSKWVTFKGRVTSMGFASHDVTASPNGGGSGSGSCASSHSRDVHANPYGGSCPAFYVGERKVVTDGDTRFKKQSGGNLDPASIAVGQKAYVEGWRKPNGAVLAAKVVIG